MIRTNQVELKITAGLDSQFPKDRLPQIAFSGRSNVGKSSLINLLTGRKSLARVSGAPGKTVTLNFYEIDRQLYFVDLPGYGYAKRARSDVRRWSSLTDRYFTANDRSDNIRLVIQLVDAKVGPTEDDCAMMEFMTRQGLPFLIVATKSDKLNKTQLAESEKTIRSAPFADGALSLVFSSSLSKAGKDEIWKKIFECLG